MLRIRLLGDCEVLGRRGKIRLRRRELALLALACAGRTQELTRDAIAAMLWPDVPLENALHSLRQALHRLSRLVPGLKCHCRDGRSVSLKCVPGNDLAEFRGAIAASDWSRATALYAGPFLGSFALDEAPDFSQWVDGLRRHLEKLATDASRRLLESAEDAGDWAVAEKAAQALLVINPEDEDALATFVGLAARLGHWVEAERAVATARRAVEASAGVPSPRLLQVEEVAARVRASNGRGGFTDELPLIGRAAEAAYLRCTLEGALTGRMKAVIVTGSAGVGKTRLCLNALRLAAIKGFRVISSAGRPLASDILAPVFCDLMNELRREGDSPPSIPQSQAEQETYAMPADPLPRELGFSAAAERLRLAMSAHPIVLFVDDAQWIDEASADFLLFTMSRLHDEPLMLLLGVRLEDAGANPGAGALMRSSHVKQLQIGDLEPAAAAQLVQAFATRAHTGIPEGIARQCLAKSGGHPFYLIESLRNWQMSGGTSAGDGTALANSIEQLISTRCVSLSATAIQVAEALALFGSAVPHEVLARVAGIDMDRAADALQELADKAFVRDSREGATFAHDLVREGIAARIGAARQKVLHRRAARALQSAHPVAFGEVAVHADLGGDRESAWRFAAAAAGDLQRRHAYEQAESLWRLALRNASSARRLRIGREHLADCLFNYGKNTEAKGIYEQLLAEGVLADGQRLLFRGRALPQDTLGGSAERALVQLLDEAISFRDCNDKTKTLIQCLTSITSNRNFSLLCDYADRLIACAHSAPEDSACMFYLNLLSAALVFMGDWARVDELQGRSIEIAKRLSISWWHGCAHGMRATTLHLRGRCRASAEAFTEAARIFAAAPERYEPSMVRLNWGVLLTEMGEFARAARHLSSVFALAQDTFRVRFGARAAANLVALYYEAGKSETALEYARAAAVANAESERDDAAIVYGVLGLLAQTPAEEKAARDKLRDVLKYEQPFGDDFSYAYMFLARQRERAGKRREALRLIERGIAMYAGKDFFCHGRLELEKARLLGVRDPEAGLALAREIRARAADAEAVLMLNKAEALIRSLKRATSLDGRKVSRVRAGGQRASAQGGRKTASPQTRPQAASSVPLAAERSRTRTELIVR